MDNRGICSVYSIMWLENMRNPYRGMINKNICNFLVVIMEVKSLAFAFI